MSAPHEAIHKLPGQVLPTLVYARMQDVEWGNALSSIQTETVSTCLYYLRFASCGGDIIATSTRSS